MKPHLLKRLDALEQAANQAMRSPVRLIDVTAFDETDRDAH